ncbi:MAG: septal ring lytic transglycosylase RlpA family protein [Deltaproteobacteria bacterium]|nr:septal ring lytic transglycosylase RlpA family protein [Deltaproteobacteria bacterium]MBW2364937.1 septal ring lytic transglycosylase RlpA family protein [Deltaproteobacteria bacterium]
MISVGNYRNKRVALTAWLVFICSLNFLIFGCATPKPPVRPTGYPKPYKVLGKWYQPLPHARGFGQCGLASWYGKKFHGRKTSNGETYDMYGISAAHKTLPLGTHVWVRNLKNNKELKVRINDRGPFVKDRIIDLSYGAAQKLGIVESGTAPVELVALGIETDTLQSEKPGQEAASLDYYKGNFTFQVGAFKVRENAERLKQELTQKYENAHIAVFDSGEETFYRVRVGKNDTLKAAEAYEKILIRDGFKNVFIIAE